MINSIPPEAHRPRSAGLPSTLFSNLTRAMLATNPGLQNIEVRLNRGGARLSDIGKLAQTLDQFRTDVSRLGGDEPATTKDFVDAVGTLEDKLRDLAANDNANGPIITRIQQQIGAILGSAGSRAPGNGLAHQLTSLVTQQMANGGMLGSEAADVRRDVDALTSKKTEITDAIRRQAGTLVQQFNQTVPGGSAIFGESGDTRPRSLFDMLA